MTTIRDRNKTNIINNKIKNNVEFTNAKNNKLNWSFWSSILSTILLLLTLVISIAALIIALKEEKKEILFTKGVSDSKLQAQTSYTTLYTYYTQSNDKTLQNYSGDFEVTVSNSSVVDFIITDENDNNITGNIVRGADNLPTSVPFKSNGDVSQLILKYKTSSTDISLLRIELNLD